MSFTDLWDAYPTERSPCTKRDGDSAYDNQCAIRLSTCFIAAGISVSTFRGAFCWHGHGREHILRAEEVADWLDGRNRPSALGATQKFEGISHGGLPGSGVVFIKDFWQRRGQSFRNRTGDHVDLYNRADPSLSSGALTYFDNAREVWYWPVV